MDPLVGLGQHGLDAEQRRALGRPVPRRTGAVLAARKHEQRDAVALVVHGGVVDECLLAVGQMDRVRALLALHEAVLEPDVPEGTPHHHLVMPASSAVGVELEGCHPVLLEPLTGG